MPENQAGQFRPLSPERAEEIKKALQRSRSTSAGLVIDQEAGAVSGSASLDNADPSKRNMIGKFDTHYQKP